MMLRIALAFIFALSLLPISSQILTPTYDVEVKEPFGFPDFIAMDLGADRLGLTGMFYNELQRAGFAVTSLDQAAKLMAPPGMQSNASATALEVYSLLDRARRVQPGLLPIKSRTLQKMAQQSGVAGGDKASIQLGISEAVRQGSFVVLPKGRIGLMPEAAPPVVQTASVEWAPPVAMGFSFNYVYRNSLSCGETCSEIYASLNDLTSGALLASLRYEQPRLSTECANEIVHRLIESLVRQGLETVEVQSGGDARMLTTVAVVPKRGVDCNRKTSDAWSRELASALVGSYTVVDRANVDALLAEQRTALEVTFNAADYVEAGRLMGAEGLVFVTAGCASGTNTLDVTLTDTTLGSLTWTVHGENTTAKSVVDALKENGRLPVH